MIRLDKELNLGNKYLKSVIEVTGASVGGKDTGQMSQVGGLINPMQGYLAGIRRKLYIGEGS